MVSHMPPPRRCFTNFSVDVCNCIYASHVVPHRPRSTFSTRCRYSILGASEAVVPFMASQPQQSAAPAARGSLGGRLSIEAGLSRLSLGFNSALQRFGLR